METITMTPSRTTTPSATRSQTYDRRTSKVIGKLDPEIEDAIVRCNPGGCSLTAQEVEKNLSGTYPVVPGSLKFTEIIGQDESEVASFTVGLRDGGAIRGIIKLKAVVERDKITAYSDIMVVGIGAKNGPAAVLLRQPSPGRR
jgi:hypothetical protein